MITFWQARLSSYLQTQHKSIKNLSFPTTLPRTVSTRWLQGKFPLTYSYWDQCSTPITPFATSDVAFSSRLRVQSSLRWYPSSLAPWQGGAGGIWCLYSSETLLLHSNWYLVFNNQSKILPPPKSAPRPSIYEPTIEHCVPMLRELLHSKTPLPHTSRIWQRNPFSYVWA